jgi:SAM-dependent methyltransferase
VGVTILNALALLQAKAEGAAFDRTLTLGRLSSFLSPRDLRRMARALPADSGFARAIARGETPVFMDDFFTALGAEQVDTLDASAFEGANIIHDLNEPLPAQLRGQYDAVVDGGTLEHVFNVPTAMKNAMEAVRVGGRFYAALPANNYCGHGFYQYSAEFFYRVFSADNGFRVERLLVAPAYASGKWLDGPAFDVADPEDLRERVNIDGRRNLLFLVQAQKIEDKPVFARWPQQSDYSAQWAAEPAARVAVHRRWLDTLRWATGRVGGVGRLASRFHARWIWRRQSRANPALKSHSWLH